MKQHTTSTVYLIHLLRPLGNPNNPRGMASISDSQSMTWRPGWSVTELGMALA